MDHQLPQRLQAFVRRRLGMPPRLVQARVLGRELLVSDGTLRGQADYDDAWLLACALRAENVFDVGAHTGDSALLVLLSRSVKRIVLIEANSAALAIAANNLILNHVSEKAHFVSAFAGDVNNSSVTFWTIGTGAAGSMYKTHATSAAKRNSFMEVPTVTIDSLCESYGVIPDLIKVDVEGAEHKVLLGSRDCALQNETRFLVEMHSNPDVPMAMNATNVLAWCRSVSYRAWYLKEGICCEESAQIQHRGRCHLLLQPSSWQYPEWLKGIKQSADLEDVIVGTNGGILV